MATDVKFLEELIQMLVEYKSRLDNEGDIQIFDAALQVAEEELQLLESDD